MINAQEMEGAAAVGDANADVVAVNRAGPVGNAVGVNLAAEDTNRRAILLMRSDVASLAGDQSGHQGDEESDESEHLGGVGQL